MLGEDKSQKKSLIERWGATATALAAIFGLIFLLFPQLKPKEPNPELAATQTQRGVSRSTTPTTEPSPISVAPFATPMIASEPNISPTSQSLDSLYKEIKVIYNEMDRAIEREGLDAYFARMADDYEFPNNDTRNDIRITKTHMRQYVQGQTEKMKMVGVSVSIPKVERAIESIIPSSDGKVGVKSTLRMTLRVTKDSFDEDKTVTQEAIEIWEKQNGRWLILHAKKTGDL